MALNNTTADALATALCSALGVVDAPTIAIYKTIYRQVYASLKADITITLAALSVVTTGSAATQTGPQSPISINPA